MAHQESTNLPPTVAQELDMMFPVTKSAPEKRKACSALEEVELAKKFALASIHCPSSELSLATTFTKFTSFNEIPTTGDASGLHCLYNLSTDADPAAGADADADRAADECAHCNRNEIACQPVSKKWVYLLIKFQAVTTPTQLKELQALLAALHAYLSEITEMPGDYLSATTQNQSDDPAVARVHIQHKARVYKQREHTVKKLSQNIEVYIETVTEALQSHFGSLFMGIPCDVDAMRMFLLQANKNNHDGISEAILQDAMDQQELLETLRKEVLYAIDPTGETSKEITLQKTKCLHKSIDYYARRHLAQSTELREFVDDVVSKLIPKILQAI